MIRWGPFLIFLSILLGTGSHSLIAQEQAETRIEGKIISQWAELLKSQETRERFQATRALKGFGHEASRVAPALIDALRDKEWLVRSGAAEALGEVAPQTEASVRALTEALKDDKWDVRSAAVIALGQSGLEAVVPSLARMLEEDKEWWVRMTALDTLAKFGPEVKGIIPALIGALKDDAGGIGSVRSSAAKALLRFVGPKATEAVPALVKALKAKDEWGQFRMDVAEALWRIDKNPAAIPALEATLRDNSLSDRSLAAAALSRIGSAAVPALIKALQDQDAFVRRKAASALEEVGPIGRPAIPALVDALKDESAFVRVYAARSLWRLDKHPAAIPALAEALTDDGGTDPGRDKREIYTAREAATDALRKLGKEAKAVVPALAKALSDKRWKDRRVAAWILENLGPDAKAAIPALTAALVDTDSQVRAAAARALGVLGPDAKEAVPALMELLKEKGVYVRESSALALWRIDKHPPVVPLFIELLRTSDSTGERYFAARHLGEVGPEAGVVPALEDALQDKEWGVRLMAVESLGKIGTKEKTVVAALLNRLEDEMTQVRLAAAKSLWQIEKHPAAVLTLAKMVDGSESGEEAVSFLASIGPEAKAARATLLEELADEKSWARGRAAEALWWIEKHPQAVPILIQILKDRKSYYSVRSNACQSLGRIGPAAREAVPAIVEVLREEDQENSWVVRHFAIRALGGIGSEAKAAVPALLDALEDEELGNRSLAAEALKKIDPQAAAKAGIR